ncbi:LamG domain-containing protein [Dokdonia donghaensis]|uniref:LamG domain-containing protein n=1 Tax=Dokdonia donghaensis TaxID=326320 RepID=UPI0035C85FA2
MIFKNLSLRYYLASLSLFIVLIGAVSCQDDLSQDESLSEVINEANASAQLLQFMHNVALNDGSIDNIIDRASCLEMVLPMTIELGSSTFTVENQEDLITVEEHHYEHPEDSITINYPVDVILMSHEVVTATSQDEMDALVETCSDPSLSDIDIECVDFQYPITFNTFDPEFQVAETVTVSSDAQLLGFITSYTGSSNVVGVAFPISLLNHDGTIVEITDYTALEDALVEAVSSCDEDDGIDFETQQGCPEEQIDQYLTSCYWQITSYNDENTLSNYTFFFSSEDGYMFFYDVNTFVESTWSTSQSDLGGVLSFTSIPVLSQELQGDWTVTECSVTTLLMQRGDDTLVFERNCFNEPLDCFTSAILGVCDNGTTNEASLDLEAALLGCDTTEVNVDYYISEEDAMAEINAISNPETYEFTGDIVIWSRISLLSDPSTYKIIFLDLTVVDCCDNPQLFLEEAVIYMPMSEYPLELLSGYYNETALNECVVDRDGNDHCAIAFAQNDFTIPVTDDNTLLQGDAFSISIWFKMQNENPGDYEVFFQKGTSSGEGFQLGAYDLNAPIFSSGNFSIWDEDWSNEVDVTWTNTDWHHLVVTVDESNTVRLYRDGILRNEITNAVLDIGSTALNVYTLGQGFQGYLDDLRVYNSTLNPTEISQLYALEGDCYTCL